MNELLKFTTKWVDLSHTTIVAIAGAQKGNLEVVGTVMVDLSVNRREEAYIWNLQVKAKCRRCGLGKRLLEAALEEAREMKCTAAAPEKVLCRNCTNSHSWENRSFNDGQYIIGSCRFHEFGVLLNQPRTCEYFRKRINPDEL